MKLNKNIKEIGIDTGSSVAGAATGLMVAGPPGAIMGAIVTPIAGSLLKRFLTQKEKDRIQRVVDLAAKAFQENIKKGAGVRKDLDKQRFQELTEGVLLKAKDAYEEKKIPLIANLLAATPFTNTPIDNMNQTLIYAEQLSYKQLCLLSIVGSGWGKELGLSDKPLIKQSKTNLFNENVEGVYADLNHLLVLGLIGQVFSKEAGPAIPSGMYMISPSSLELLYPGRLVYNSMQLAGIDDFELDPFIKILRDPNVYVEPK